MIKSGYKPTTESSSDSSTAFFIKFNYAGDNLSDYQGTAIVLAKDLAEAISLAKKYVPSKFEDAYAFELDKTHKVSGSTPGTISDLKSYFEQYPQGNLRLIDKSGFISKSKALKSTMNESIYFVSGSTPTGYGDSEITMAKGSVNDPAKAIEQWFKIGAKHRAGTDITAVNKSDAIKLINWANTNQDKIREWYQKYGSAYKLDYLLQEISKQAQNKCRGFYEGEFGDSIHPFTVG